MEVLTNIGFDWQVALTNFVSFILIYLILKKWVFGPVGEMLEKRKSLIEEGVNKAELSEQELSQAQEKAEEIIKESRKEANSIVASAKDQGDTLILKATTKAQVEANEVHARAKESLIKEQNNMEQELLSKTAHLVSLGVQKLLKEEVDASRNEELTNRALEALDAHKAQTK